MAGLRDLFFSIGWDINDKPLDDINKKTDSLVDTMQDIGKTADKTSRTYVDANGKMRDEHGRFVKTSESGNKKIQSSNKNTEKSFGSLSNKISGLGGIAVKAFAIGASAVTSFAVGATAYGISQFADFQSSMNEVFTLLPGISQDAMTEMSGQVKDFAGDFGVLPEEVVPALYQSLSAGVPKDNVFEFLETAQMAAMGGVTELETAVDGISSVVNAYGSDVVDATEASDKMFTAVKLGKTTFDELSGSLYNVIPTASALGVEFGDVTAGLAAMTAQGTPTRVASTQLRQLFVELSKEGTKTSDVFKEIAGVGFKDFLAQGYNVQDGLQLLEAYSQEAGLGINDLFGSVEAGSAALSLTGKGTEAFSNALSEMGNSAGATETAFDRMDQGIGRAMDKLKANLNVAAIDLGQEFAPIVISLADAIMENLPAIRSFVGGFMSGLGTVMGKVSDFINTLSPLTDKVFPMLMSLGSSVLNFYINKWTTLGKNVMPAFNSIMDTLTSKGLPLFIDMFNYVKDNLLPPIMSMVFMFGDAWVGFADGLAVVLPSMIDGLSGLWDIIKIVLDDILWKFNLVWPAISNIVGTTIDAIFDIVAGLFKILNGIIDFVAGVFTGDWQRAWDGIKDIFIGVWDTLVATFKGVLNVIIGGINGIFDGLSNTKIPDWVPGIGGKEIGFNMPDIPMLAQGTEFFKGGPAIVGEKGPELVNLERGSTVTPNSKSKRMLGGNNNTFSPSITVYVDGNKQNGMSDISKEIEKEMYPMFNKFFKQMSDSKLANAVEL